MILHTARISYRGRDRLDISRAGNDQFGVLFAPSWKLVNAGKAGEITWDEYSARYRAEMRDSYRANRAAWERLILMDEVTLCCYCRAGDPCHRLLLADIIVALCERLGIGCDYLRERCGNGSQAEMFVCASNDPR